MAGEGTIVLVANGYEELPPIADDKKHSIYNYATHSAKFSFLRPAFTRSGGPAEAATTNETPIVYTLEGATFDKSNRVVDPTQPRDVTFEPDRKSTRLNSSH